MVRAPVFMPASTGLRHLLNQPSQGVLSVCLDTSPERMPGEAYRIVFDEACRRLRADVPESEVAAFNRAVEQAAFYLREEVSRHPGVVLYASGRSDYFFAVLLPYRPADTARWGILPWLEPLEKALEEYRRVGVVLFDKERARLFTIFLGEIEEQLIVEDYVPGKQSRGGWAALAQSHYARHRKEHIRRHVAHTIERLLELRRTHPFERWLLGGPPEALAALRSELPRQLAESLAGTFKRELFSTDAEVVEATECLARDSEHEAELHAVAGLIEDAPHTALGIDATVDVLEAGRADQLFVAETLAAAGTVCRGCHRLVPYGTAPCPWCGGPVVVAGDFRQQIIDRALRLGVKVHLLTAEPSAKLAEHGGIGVRVRY